MQQTECAKCTDYITGADFDGRLICPICYERATKKLDAAVVFIGGILSMLQNDPALFERASKILSMRSY
jgi:hypothetical protein